MYIYHVCLCIYLLISIFVDNFRAMKKNWPNVSICSNYIYNESSNAATLTPNSGNPYPSTSFRNYLYLTPPPSTAYSNEEELAERIHMLEKIALRDMKKASGSVSIQQQGIQVHIYVYMYV
jgi:hypothetical protein